MSALFDSQNAGEETVEELDKLRHADGNVTVADLRLEMQKVSKIYTSSHRYEQVVNNQER